MGDRTIRVATYANERDNAPKVAEVPWRALAKDLSTHRRTNCAPCAGHHCKAKSGPAWSPVDIEGARSSANVKAITAAVFDLDGVDDLTMAGLAERLQGREYICHSTHSGHGSYRLVLSLTRPVLRSEWARFWPNAVAFLDLPADPKAKDPARLYYFPSCPEGSEPLAEEGFGSPLDVDAVLSMVSAIAPATAPGLLPHQGAAAVSTEGLRGQSRLLIERVRRLEPLAPEGERDDTVNRVMSILANMPEMSLEGAMSFIATSLERMPLEPEGLEYWRKKAEGCFVRAAERRAKRDVQAAADRDTLLNLLGREPGIAVEGTNEEWRHGLLYRKDKEGNPIGLQEVEANLELILANDPRWKGTLKFNALRKTIDVFGGPLAGVPMADLEFATAVWFQRSEYRLALKPFSYGAALLFTARANTYDPLADYLSGLVWDGEGRAETFLQTYLKVDDSVHTRILGKKWLVSAVARALSPGCKVDTTLILQGDYGTRKTTFVQTMAGEFYSNAKIDFSSNDSRQAAAKYWLIEMPELTGLKRANRDAVKDWLSTCTDSYRPPYGRVLEDFPRRAVFVGTTNDDDFLSEPNRREWVIHVGDIDIEGLRVIRDQLWAEAVATYRAGETCPECAESVGNRCGEHSWWLKGATLEAVREIAREYASPDPWRDLIVDWYVRMDPAKRPVEVTTAQIALDALGFTKDRLHLSLFQGIGYALRGLGFSKVRRRLGGRSTWMYATPAVLMAVPKGARSMPATMEVLEGGGT